MLPSCKEVVARASALIDGEMSAFEVLQMRLHLAMCKGCDRFVKQLRLTRDLTRLAAVPPHLSEADHGRITAILSHLPQTHLPQAHLPQTGPRRG